VDELVSSLEEYLDTIEKNLPLFTNEDDRIGVRQVLTAIVGAAQMIYNDLQRIFVYPSTGESIKFEGFIPTKSVESFRSAIGKYLVSAEPVKTQGEDAPYVPALLVNPRMIAIFESLTLQRGLPRYGEVDPTPILAFVFPLFFGIMFGDVGHGIVLLAFGLYLVYKTPFKTWGNLILILSSSSMVVGFIRGSIFGIPFTSPVRRIIWLPPVFSAGFTLSYIPLLLEIAIVIGTFHLASAYAISFVNKIRAGYYLDAFLEKLPTIVLYGGILNFGFAIVGTSLNASILYTSQAPTPVYDDILGVTIPISETVRISIPVIIATILVLIAGHPIREYVSTRSLKSAVKGLGGGLLEAVAKPFEFMINSLSYIRLGVLLITTTVLGSLVAGVLYDGIVGAILAIFLNVAVIGLEGLIVYIQDMRLQIYEWFSQFYISAGVPFIPLVSQGRDFTVNWL
jgi:V/A-type H+-transporting ATPase subunit I